MVPRSNLLLALVTVGIVGFVTYKGLYFGHTSTARPKRVYVDMVGDLFHHGHVNFLRQAKEHGDYLIVGLHSDEDAASYKRYPIMHLDERAQLLAACKYVDEIILNSPLYMTREFIAEHSIDLVIHGDDWPRQLLGHYYKVPMEMGIFKTVPYTDAISTTALINRVRDYFQSSQAVDQKTVTA